MKSEFPENFLWTVATSAYQFEGTFPNDGKGLSIQDVRTKDELLTASDHLHHLEEDLDLLQKLGVKAYRFSISWTRIFPQGIGEINQQGLEFYQALIQGLVDRKIIPIATAYHDDLPLVLAEQGGWNNRKTIDAFVDYCKFLFENFGRQVGYWIPICEQNLLTIEQLVEEKKSLKQIFQENHHLFLAQAKVTAMYRKMGYSGKVMPSPNLVEVYPNTSSPQDILASRYMELVRNWFYLDVFVHGEYPSQMISLLKELAAMPEFEKEDEQVLKEGTCDILAFSNYTSVTVKASETKRYKDKTGMKYGFNLPGYFEITVNTNLGDTEFAYEDDLIGTRILLENVYQRYRLPIFLIKRGLGCKEELGLDGAIHDEKRIRYLQRQIIEMKRAIENGVNIVGYCSWSGFDLVSTSNGLQKRYGMIYVNRDDIRMKQCHRICKDSYLWFQKVIKTNGNDLSE